jgi:hypothetical protein
MGDLLVRHLPATLRRVVTRTLHLQGLQPAPANRLNEKYHVINQGAAPLTHRPPPLSPPNTTTRVSLALAQVETLPHVNTNYQVKAVSSM